MDSEAPILIVGGYGVVGAQVASLLRKRHPTWPLVLAGRRPAQGEALAQELGLARPAAIDVLQRDPLAGLASPPRAVLALVNDPDDHLLLAAVRRGIPVVDVTRWTSRMQDAAWRLSAERLEAPVRLASSWMGGTPAMLAAMATRGWRRLRSVRLGILYAVEDQAGPNSVEYMDRLHLPFPVWREGRRELAHPMSEARRVQFPGGQTATVHRIDTPEQATLPLVLGAESATTGIAFDDPAATTMLAWMVKVGIWRALSGKAFTGLRRELLHQPGPGAAHELVLELEGEDGAGQAQALRLGLRDPLGQTHLTALGAVLQLERVLGADGRPAATPGVSYPESDPSDDWVRAAWAAEGIQVTGEEAPAPRYGAQLAR